MATEIIETFPGNLNIAGHVTIGSTANPFIPRYGIIMWNGLHTAVPSGWVLCDGNNGTPNLRNRFIITKGVTSQNNALGQTGGTLTKTLNTNEMAPHSHYMAVSSWGGSHTHYSPYYKSNNSYGWPAQGGGNMSWWDNNPGILEPVTNHAYNHSHYVALGQSTPTGATSFQKTPPYYALAFIMKT